MSNDMSSDANLHEPDESTAPRATTEDTEASTVLGPQRYWSEKLEWNEPDAPNIRRIWAAVRDGIDTSQTVDWRLAMEAVTHVHTHWGSSFEARDFWEHTVGNIVGILLEQDPTQMGEHEQKCIKETILLATRVIVSRDLLSQICQHIQLAEDDRTMMGAHDTCRFGICSILPLLGQLFDKTMPYYQKIHVEQVNSSCGCPQILLDAVKMFDDGAGFALSEFWKPQWGERPFPVLDTMLPLLTALYDTMVATAAVLRRYINSDRAAPSAAELARHERLFPNTPFLSNEESNALSVSQDVMSFVSKLSGDTLKEIPDKVLSGTFEALRRIFDWLVTGGLIDQKATAHRGVCIELRPSAHRGVCIEFYKGWRSLIWIMLANPSLTHSAREHIELMLNGINDNHHMPPLHYICSGADVHFCNGVYHYDRELTSDGYHEAGYTTLYARNTTVSNDVSPSFGVPGRAVKLTLGRKNRQWSLAEVQDDDSGRVDYYIHGCKGGKYPPQSGWVARGNAEQCPLTLAPRGVLVPIGEESETVEYQLASWMIRKRFMEHVSRACMIDRVVGFLNNVSQRYQDIPILFGRSLWKQYREHCQNTPIAASRSAASFMERFQSEPDKDGRFCSIERIALALFLESTGGNSTAVSVSMPLSHDAYDVDVAKAVVRHLNSLSEKRLNSVPPELLSLTLQLLQLPFNAIWTTRRPTCVKFFTVWRCLTFTLITCSCPSLKDIGWEQVNEMIRSSENRHPQPSGKLSTGLARWVIENGVLERLVNDPTLKQNVIQSSNLISFLHSVCVRDRDISILLGVYMSTRYLARDESLA